MAGDTCRVVFQPEGKAVHVPRGTTIYEAAGEAGISITADCGGAGTCGRCRVIVTSGSCRQQGSERFLSPQELERGEVLACRAQVTGDLVVEIPLSSRPFQQKVLTVGEQRHLKLSPVLRKKTVTVEEPTLESPRADLDRVWRALGYSPPGPPVPVDLLRLLPEMLRSDQGSITAVLDGGRIIGLEPGDTSAASRGV
ncbi:MAG: 2Fe-2S iron-sulfur cluster-binding protein, partial [Spirochaetota bacterium]